MSLDDLRKIRGYSLSTLMRGRQKIPESPGVYIWRYWPLFANLEQQAFLDAIAKWTATQPQFEEIINNSRLSVSIRRTPFGSAVDKNVLFGFKETNPKASALMNAIEESEDTRQVLAYTLESLLASAPPLYVGKADNLRLRLSNHFDGQSSSLLASIKDAGINVEDVFISFLTDPVSDVLPDQITTAIEEIVQRISNPPLTKRYG